MGCQLISADGLASVALWLDELLAATFQVLFQVQDQHNATSVIMDVGRYREWPCQSLWLCQYPHHLGKEEALRRLKTGLAEVGTSFGHLFSVTEQIWTGDRLRFQVSAIGQSASGSIDVADDHVRLEVFSALVFGKARRNNPAAVTKGRNVTA